MDKRPFAVEVLQCHHTILQLSTDLTQTNSMTLLIDLVFLCLILLVKVLQSARFLLILECFFLRPAGCCAQIYRTACVGSHAFSREKFWQAVLVIGRAYL